MAYNTKNDVSLSMLRKYDPHCSEILDTCNPVKMYNFDKTTNSWLFQGQSEGAFYLVKRLSSPLYKFIILGKYNKPGTFIPTISVPISNDHVFHCQKLFYMFKNNMGVIQAVMFPNKNDCDRISRKIEGIVSDLKRVPESVVQPNISEPRSYFTDPLRGVLGPGRSQHKSPEVDINGDKIITLLESARQRYQEGHPDPAATLATSNPDHRPRQINLNDLFMSSNGLTNTIPVQSPATVAMTSVASSYPPRPPVSKTMSTDIKESGPTTFTVTELEKFFVQGASGTSMRKACMDDSEEDDDMRLLEPNMFSGTSAPRQHETQNGLLSKDQMKEALIHMIESDNDGQFVSKLHSAYLDLCRKRADHK